VLHRHLPFHDNRPAKADADLSKTQRHRYVLLMPDLDLEPRRHSHLYEVKPMSRWWLVVVLPLVCLPIWLNGFDRIETWGLLFMGWMLGLGMVMVFPRTFLSKLD
jgi:hypothetical protein